MTNVVEFPKTNKVIYSDDDGNEIRYGEIVQVLDGPRKGMLFIAEKEYDGMLYGCLYENEKYEIALEHVDWCAVVGEAALIPVDPAEEP